MYRNSTLPLFSQNNQGNDIIYLNQPFLTSHLITYIGNKRRLLPFINNAFLDIKKNLGKKKIISFDGFSGSGVVSRLLKYHSSLLISNDLEKYTETINNAYLSNKNNVDIREINQAISFLNTHKYDRTKSDYFISKNYSPKDDRNIKEGERVFYTNANANIIDNIRYLIETEIPKTSKIFCLANLLIQASIHNNTSGVFKGFHKKDGIGHFGGKGENALSRIKGEISLETPLFSDVECEVIIKRQDTNTLIPHLQELDLAYYDPPYNQHPYGSNYFMLNIINDGKPIEIQNGISGISKNWNRSVYNKQTVAEDAMEDLISKTPAKYIAISYNNEGIIPIKRFQKILDSYGKWVLYEQEYNTYRGSRNLSGRDIKVKELLWVLKKN